MTSSARAVREGEHGKRPVPRTGEDAGADEARRLAPPQVLTWGATALRLAIAPKSSCASRTRAHDNSAAPILMESHTCTLPHAPPARIGRGRGLHARLHDEHSNAHASTR